MIGLPPLMAGAVKHGLHALPWREPLPASLEDEAAWIEHYRQMLSARLDRLEAFLEKTKGKS